MTKILIPTPHPLNNNPLNLNDYKPFYAWFVDNFKTLQEQARLNNIDVINFSDWGKWVYLNERGLTEPFLN